MASKHQNFSLYIRIQYLSITYKCINYLIFMKNRSNQNIKRKQEIICTPISFNNPIKACFSNMKHTVLIQTRTKQMETCISYSKTGFNWIFRDY